MSNTGWWVYLCATYAFFPGLLRHGTSFFTGEKENGLCRMIAEAITYGVVGNLLTSKLRAS
jgi:hypothetical protein